MSKQKFYILECPSKILGISECRQKTSGILECWQNFYVPQSQNYKKPLLILNKLVLPSLALCNEDANGNVPLGKSCNRYWQCQGGYPRLQRCPAMLVFDRRSLRCVVPPTEDCDVPTTPPPPPEDLDEDGEQNIPQDLRGRPQNHAQNHRNQKDRDRDDINIPNLPPGAISLQGRNPNRN